MNKTNVAIGVLAGLAVGALLGVLFAPDKGSETRKKLTRKAADTADDLKGKFNDLVGNLEDNYQTSKEAVEEIYDNINYKS